MVKSLPAIQETWVWSLGQEDPLEKGMATHSSILAWRIPWTEGMSYSPWSCKESDMTKGLTVVFIADLQCCVMSGAYRMFSHTYTHIFSFSDFFSRLVITEYWVEFPVICHRSLLINQFIYDSVCMLIPTSYFIPPHHLSPLVTITFFSQSVSLSLVCK